VDHILQAFTATSPQSTQAEPTSMNCMSSYISLVIMTYRKINKEKAILKVCYDFEKVKTYSI